MLVPAQARVPQLPADDAVAARVLTLEAFLLVRPQSDLSHGGILKRLPDGIAPSRQEAHIVVGALKDGGIVRRCVPTDVRGGTGIEVLAQDRVVTEVLTYP